MDKLAVLASESNIDPNLTQEARIAEHFRQLVKNNSGDGSVVAEELKNLVQAFQVQVPRQLRLAAVQAVVDELGRSEQLGEYITPELLSYALDLLRDDTKSVERLLSTAHPNVLFDFEYPAGISPRTAATGI